MVEHLLAKEDVASSSLVTRSSLRLGRSESEGWSVRRSLGEDGLPETAKLLLAGRRQNQFEWNARVAVKDKTPSKLPQVENEKLPSPSQTFLESSTGEDVEACTQGVALSNHVSAAKGSGPALAARARRDFGSARSGRAGSDFQTGAEEITTRNSV